MALSDTQNSGREYGALVKTETYELYNMEGFRVYGRLEVYENCSTYFINIFEGESSAICPPVLGGHSYQNDHEKLCRQELRKHLKSKELKIVCKRLAAERENV